MPEFEKSHVPTSERDLPSVGAPFAALETKADDGSDLSALAVMEDPDTPAVGAGEDVARSFDAFFSAFEAYRDTNEARLAEIESRGYADVLTRDKLSRIDAALDNTKRRLDDLVLKARRPGLSVKARPQGSGLVSERKAAFEAYMRQGKTGARTASGFLELKTLTTSDETGGGYMVPEETETEILRRLSNASPIRAIAGNRQISSSVYKRPFSSAGPATAWVGETDTRPVTGDATLQELSFPAMELYAMPVATSTLLDDTAVDIESWLAEEVETAFAEMEGAAFINGTGANMPTGFLTYDTAANDGWKWGTLGTISAGQQTAFTGATATDTLVDLIYALKSGYRQNATFVMNRRTQASLRKLKDSDGRYLWAPPASAGAPATLMGFPVTEAEDMPDIGSAALPVAFGDFHRGYLVVDRMGIRVLRDPYSSKPNVLFYTTKRVGGGVQDFDAIKLLAFETDATSGSSEDSGSSETGSE